MIGRDIHEELKGIRSRTRRLMIISAGVHAMLLLWLMVLHPLLPEEPTLTEITWIDAVEASPVSLPKTPAISEPQPAPAVAQRPSYESPKELVRREVDEADITPLPQSTEALENKITERLVSLQQQEQSQPKEIASLITPSPVGRPKLAGTSTEVRTPSQLTRDDRPVGGTPIELKRSRSKVQKAVVMTSPIPEREPEHAQPKQIGSTATRNLAGAQMAGPVADRPIISYTAPNYPDWAKGEGVEASVMIYFVVRPNGQVKENVMVQKTSGFADFDDNAVNAILTWRFQPLSEGQTGDQWGTIMFQYRLTD